MDTRCRLQDLLRATVEMERGRGKERERELKEFVLSVCLDVGENDDDDGDFLILSRRPLLLSVQFGIILVVESGVFVA